MRYLTNREMNSATTRSDARRARGEQYGRTHATPQEIVAKFGVWNTTNTRPDQM